MLVWLSGRVLTGYLFVYLCGCSVVYVFVCVPSVLCVWLLARLCCVFGCVIVYVFICMCLCVVT